MFNIKFEREVTATGKNEYGDNVTIQHVTLHLPLLIETDEAFYNILKDRFPNPRDLDEAIHALNKVTAIQYLRESIE